MTHPPQPSSHPSSQPPRDARPDLLRAIAARARETPDEGLVACALAGLFAVGALAWWRPDWWPRLLPLVALGAWGGWGVLDRALAERAARRATGTPGSAPGPADTVLASLRAVLAALGVATGVLGMFVVMAGLLGTIVS